MWAWSWVPTSRAQENSPQERKLKSSKNNSRWDKEGKERRKKSDINDRLRQKSNDWDQEGSRFKHGDTQLRSSSLTQSIHPLYFAKWSCSYKTTHNATCISLCITPIPWDSCFDSSCHKKPRHEQKITVSQLQHWFGSNQYFWLSFFHFH